MPYENSNSILTRIFGAEKVVLKKGCVSFGSNPLRHVPVVKLQCANTLLQARSRSLTSKASKEKAKAHITFLWQIKLYRGLRHHTKLPCRGQRTRTNAKTSKKRPF